MWQQYNEYDDVDDDVDTVTSDVEPTDVYYSAAIEDNTPTNPADLQWLQEYLALGDDTLEA
jgi:hypothetical protein